MKITTRPAYKTAHNDMALDHGPDARPVVWTVALTVFFMTLALTVNFALTAATGGWVTGLSGLVSVEIPPPAAARDEPAFRKSVENVMTLSQRHPAVDRGALLEKKDVAGLLEQWTGTSLPANMPLPALIDLHLVRGADVQKLSRDIRAVAPTAVVDTHHALLADVILLDHVTRLFVIILTVVVAILASVTIAGVVRAKCAIHTREIETLHLIGASDTYIARQFRRHALRHALHGGVWGAGLTCAFLFILFVATRGMDPALLPDAPLRPAHWAFIAFAPFLAALVLARVTAQRTVMRELQKLP